MSGYDIFEILMNIVFSVAPFIVIIFVLMRFFKPTGPKISKMDELVVNEIRKNDPGFDIMSFKVSAAACIKEVFDCFYNLDSERLKVLESSDLYEMHKIDFETSLVSGYFYTLNVPENINFTLEKYYIDGDKEVLVCSAFVGSKEVVFDPKTKESLKDDVPSYTLSKMNLEFSRGLGVKTVLGNEFTITKCPNCGAEISLNVQGQCSYCNSTIVNGSHSWVLNKITDFFTN